MKYQDLIIKEANYASYFDNSTVYPSEDAFMTAITAKFGKLTLGPSGLKRSAPKAGGAIYLKDDKLGIVGYMKPAPGTTAYQWFAAKTPFQAASKTTPTEVKSAPVKAPTALTKDKEAPIVNQSTVSDSDLELALRSLLRQLIAAKPPKWGNYQTDPVEKSQNRSYMTGIRDWGVWQMPEGEDDDGDYDWEVLSDKSANNMQQIVDSFGTKYPGIKFGWSTEEKNWIMFFAKAK
jgi:hypothetical protein